MTLVREINLIEFKINVINSCISYLNIFKDDQVLNILRQFVPVYGKFNPENEEQYDKDLQAVINYSKKFVIELENKSFEFEELVPKNKQVVTRTYFDRLIIQVSRFVKYQISKYTISVTEFANLVAEMRRYNDYLIQQQNVK